MLRCKLLVSMTFAALVLGVAVAGAWAASSSMSASNTRKSAAPAVDLKLFVGSSLPAARATQSGSAPDCQQRISHQIGLWLPCGSSGYDFAPCVYNEKCDSIPYTVKATIAGRLSQANGQLRVLRQGDLVKIQTDVVLFYLGGNRLHASQIAASPLNLTVFVRDGDRSDGEALTAGMTISYVDFQLDSRFPVEHVNAAAAAAEGYFAPPSASMDANRDFTHAFVLYVQAHPDEVLRALLAVVAVSGFIATWYFWALVRWWRFVAKQNFTGYGIRYRQLLVPFYMSQAVVIIYLLVGDIPFDALGNLFGGSMWTAMFAAIVNQTYFFRRATTTTVTAEGEVNVVRRGFFSWSVPQFKDDADPACTPDMRRTNEADRWAWKNVTIPLAAALFAIEVFDGASNSFDLSPSNIGGKLFLFGGRIETLWFVHMLVVMTLANTVGSMPRWALVGFGVMEIVNRTVEIVVNRMAETLPIVPAALALLVAVFVVQAVRLPRPAPAAPVA